jgi:hypothetical protein
MDSRSIRLGFRVKSKVMGCFDGGSIMSDAGAPLLRDADQARNIAEAFSSCFVDYWDQVRAWASRPETRHQRVGVHRGRVMKAHCNVSAAPFRCLSRVHNPERVSNADASRCTSIHPMPRPWRRCLSIRCMTSESEARTACGSDLRSPSISLRLTRLPHASSPIT